MYFQKNTGDFPAVVMLGTTDSTIVIHHFAPPFGTYFIFFFPSILLKSKARSFVGLEPSVCFLHFFGGGVCVEIVFE